MFLFRIIFFLHFFNFPYKSLPRYRTLQGKAQGSSYRIVYEDKLDRDYSKSIDSLLLVVDKSMSLWDSESLISKINKNRPYGQVDTHFEFVFRRSNYISKHTNGYFDATVGPLVKAYGFSKSKGLKTPSESQIDSIRTFVGYKKVKLANGKINKKYPEIQLDFNAIAQGYTVDLLSDFLLKNNVRNFLVEVGGEIRAKGRNQELKYWKVGIENPKDENKLQVVVALENTSLATSGSYRNFFLKDGQKYSHAIDPFTGRPVIHNMLSITVLAQKCIDADAYATAFLVMGLDKAKQVANNNRIDFFAIYEEDGQLKTWHSAGFQKVLVNQ